ncbi:MAG TPA: hypothetical protein VFG05_06895 [Methylocella sp.]|nr:hypothetical protein [Methylocella sp.]
MKEQKLVTRKLIEGNFNLVGKTVLFRQRRKSGEGLDHPFDIGRSICNFMLLPAGA